MKNKPLLEKLTEAGRKEYDVMQYNCSKIASMTDEELAREPNPGAELFGQAQHPEDRREEARKTQDHLAARGREAYAVEYAQINMGNRCN